MPIRVVAAESGLVGALGPGALRQRWGVAPSRWKRAVQLLVPVGDVPGWPIAVDNAHRLVGGVGYLVEAARRNEHSLTGADAFPLGAETHFAPAGDYEVDLFLFLVVPGRLPAVGFERDLAHAEVLGLDG